MLPSSPPPPGVTRKRNNCFDPWVDDKDAKGTEFIARILPLSSFSHFHRSSSKPNLFSPRVKRFPSQHQRGPNRLRSSWDSKSSSRKSSQALNPSKSTQQNKPRYLPQGVLLLQPLLPEVALSQTVGGTMENGPSGKLGNC